MAVETSGTSWPPVLHIKQLLVQFYITTAYEELHHTMILRKIGYANHACI